MIQNENNHGRIEVFTDGSSRGNPGPGGWGAIIQSKVESQKSKGGDSLTSNHQPLTSKVWELGGREERTTNNRMELMAMLETLRFIEKRKLSGDIVIHTDSAYTLNGAKAWMYSWEKNDWKTKTDEPVANQDLWKELLVILYRIARKHEVIWQKVEGHVGLRGNERADEIATTYADGGHALLYVGAYADYEKMIGGALSDQTELSKSLRDVKEKARAKKKDTRVAYSYVSMVGGMIATDKTWPDCERRVKGKSAAKYQKVFSREEELELIARWTMEGLQN